MLNIHKMAFLAIITLLLVQAGCTPAVQTTPMSIDEARYDPVVARYPASVGVYFPADFYENNFYNETNDGHHHTFHNNPADATRRALELAFSTIFAEVRYLDTLQESLDDEDLAFVVVPNIVSLRADLAPEVIAVMVVYQIEFFADGRHLHSWRISGIDSVSRLSLPTVSTPGGPTGQKVLPRAISPEKFDEVARMAVWDATSVFLTEFDEQQLLTDRLPASGTKAGAEKKLTRAATDQVTMAMVGPVFDQEQEPEKQRLEACLIEEIEDNGLSLKTVPHHDLRDRLYPWLSRSNYPRNLSDVEEILAQTVVRKRLQELGIHYVMYWDGRTIRSQFEGPFYATAYGVLGYESSDKTSVIRADLLAVADGKVVNSFESQREGTDVLIGLGLIPLPIYADTEEDVCAEITSQVDSFLQANAQHVQESR